MMDEKGGDGMGIQGGNGNANQAKHFNMHTFPTVLCFFIAPLALGAHKRPKGRGRGTSRGHTDELYARMCAMLIRQSRKQRELFVYTSSHAFGLLLLHSKSQLFKRFRQFGNPIC